MNLCLILCWNKSLASGNYATVPNLPSHWTKSPDSISVTRRSLSGWLFFGAQPYNQSTLVPIPQTIHFLCLISPTWASRFHLWQVYHPVYYPVLKQFYPGVLGITSLFICYSNPTDSVMRKIPLKMMMKVMLIFLLKTSPWNLIGVWGKLGGNECTLLYLEQKEYSSVTSWLRFSRRGNRKTCFSAVAGRLGRYHPGSVLMLSSESGSKAEDHPALEKLQKSRDQIATIISTLVFP